MSLQYIRITTGLIKTNRIHIYKAGIQKLQTNVEYENGNVSVTESMEMHIIKIGSR